MRYSIVSKGLTQGQLKAEVKKIGASNIKSTKLLGQVFCELDREQAERLAQTAGLVIKPLMEYTRDERGYFIQDNCGAAPAN